MEKKMTKREKFEFLLTLEDVLNHELMVEFINDEISALDKRAEKAKERAAERRAKNDELTAKIAEILTEEPQTISEILKALNDETLTQQKIVTRLSKLESQGAAVKQNVKLEDGRTIKGYSIAVLDAVE